MKCFVTGNSAVNVECGARVKDPSSARPDSAALAACELWAHRPVHAHNTRWPQLMVWGWEHKAQSCLKGEIIGLGHYLKQSFTGSIVLRPVKQSGELGPVCIVPRPDSKILFMTGWHSLDHNQIWLGLVCQRYPCVASSSPSCNQAFHTPGETDLMYLHRNYIGINT